MASKSSIEVRSKRVEIPSAFKTNTESEESLFVISVSVYLNLFRIPGFDIRVVLHFQAENIVSRDRTVKAFEVKLAN